MKTTGLHLSTLLLPALVLSGCYSYSTALSDQPTPGTELAVTLNDRGRVGLEPLLGPEVWQVEGSLVAADDSTVTLRMAKTSTLEHTEMHWAGETVTLRKDYLRSMMGRQFSASRTIILAGTATAGVVAFLATRTLLGFGSGAGGGPGSGGGTGTQ